jgi:hypothetical protein
MSDRDISGILGWAKSGGLVQWFDGLWRGRGAAVEDDDFEDRDVKALVAMGLLEITPAGVALKPPPTVRSPSDDEQQP